MKKKLIICVTGDRHLKDTKRIGRLLMKKRDRIRIVIQGGSGKADNAALDYAQLLGIPTATYEANWAKLDKAAGPIRNRTMLRHGRPDEVWAFSSNLKASKGTRDCVHAAKEMGIRVRYFK